MTGGLVALKVRRVTTEETRRAADRERELLERIRPHRGVPVLVDVFDAPGHQVIVTEWVAAATLDRLIQKQGRPGLPWDTTIDVLRQVADVVVHLRSHDPPVVHGDVKPGNILVRPDGSVVVIDIGIGPPSGLAAPLTSRGFDAPECAGGEVGSGADVYGLAAVALACLTGSPPASLDDAELARRPGLRDVVGPALRTRVEDRPTVEDLIGALERWGGGLHDVGDGWFVAGKVEDGARLWACYPTAMPGAVERLRQAVASAAEHSLGVAWDSEDSVVIAVRDRRTAGILLDRLRIGLTGAAWPGGVPLRLGWGDGPTEDEARARVTPAPRVAERSAPLLPALEGRAAEMRALRAAVARADRGAGGLTVITAEAGIGKTRLAEELAARCRSDGVEVAWGRCYATGAPPYQPWIEALGTCVAVHGPHGLAKDLTRDAAEPLSLLVPEVAELFPELGPVRPAAPRAARRRLHAAVSHLLGVVAERVTLLLVIDDLQWADPASRGLMRSLVRTLGGRRILLLVLTRPGDEEESFRTPGASVVDLAGLPTEALNLVVAALAGVDTHEATVGLISAHADGNPFIAAEYVRLLRREGRLDADDLALEVPDGARQVVRARVYGLSDAAREVLAVASIMGREFDEELLAASLPSSVDVHGALSESRRARIIRRGRFDHAVIRETIYEDLDADLRARLHGRVALALDRTDGSRAHIERIAHHYCEAVPGGELEPALRYCRLAAAHAREVLAYEQSESWWRRALDSLERSGSGTAADRSDVLLELARSRRDLGNRAGALQAIGEAVRLARGLDDPSRFARAALARGALADDGTALDEDAGALALEALEALGPSDCAERAVLLAQYARARCADGPSGERARHRTAGAEAVMVARRIGDPSALARALLAQRWTLIDSPDVARRRSLSREARSLAERADEPDLRLQAVGLTYVDSLCLGDTVAATAELERMRRLAVELGQPGEMWRPVLWEAAAALAAGRLDHADTLSLEALVLGQGLHGDVAQQHRCMQEVFIQRAAGRVEDARGRLEVDPDLVTSPVGAALCVLVDTEIRRSARAGALRRAVERAISAADDDTLAAFLLLAVVAHRVGDRDLASVLAGRLAPFATSIGVLGRHGAVLLGPVDRYRSLLAETLGDHRRCALLREAARTQAERIGLRHWIDRPHQVVAPARLPNG